MFCITQTTIFSKNLCIAQSKFLRCLNVRLSPQSKEEFVCGLNILTTGGVYYSSNNLAKHLMSKFLRLLFTVGPLGRFTNSQLSTAKVSLLFAKTTQQPTVLRAPVV